MTTRRTVSGGRFCSAGIECIPHVLILNGFVRMLKSSSGYKLSFSVCMLLVKRKRRELCAVPWAHFSHFWRTPCHNTFVRRVLTSSSSVPAHRVSFHGGISIRRSSSQAVYLFCLSFRKFRLLTNSSTLFLFLFWNPSYLFCQTFLFFEHDNRAEYDASSSSGWIWLVSVNVLDDFASPSVRNSDPVHGFTQVEHNRRPPFCDWILTVSPSIWTKIIFPSKFCVFCR